MDKALTDSIQELVRKREYLFTIHAGDRITERHIAVEEVEQALLSDRVEVVEATRTTLAVRAAW
ncbi:MAG: hypothetical protein L6427_13430 [Actinomycetia bacterium]|nr:hypothetical protein [Actinomycetes bacterium]